MKKSQEKALYSIPGWEDFLSQDFTKEFLSFEEARNYVHNLELNGSEAWFKWCKSGDKPDGIPAGAYRVYKDSGWISWGDFLGTDRFSIKTCLSFEEARKFARNLKLNGQSAWFKWSKSGGKPNIPVTPNAVYKDSGWISWGDFLGTGNISSQNRNYRSFEETRKFARNLKFKREGFWRKWCKSGDKPDDIPACPSRIYKDSGWISWGDFLGTGNVHKKKFRSFEDARKFARNLKLSGSEAWRKWSKSSERPDDIPAAPSRTYKDSGWFGMGDFLGTGNVASKNRKYRSFEEARKFVRNLKLSGSEAWFKWCKSSGKPNDITAVPNRTYKDSGWVSWGDFLGTGRIATLNLKFRSFEEAKEFVHGLKLNSVRSWNKWRKSGERQDDIPTNPNRTYRNSWVSWGDWLGKR